VPVVLFVARLSDICWKSLHSWFADAERRRTRNRLRQEQGCAERGSAAWLNGNRLNPIRPSTMSSAAAPTIPHRAQRAPNDRGSQHLPRRRAPAAVGFIQSDGGYCAHAVGIDGPLDASGALSSLGVSFHIGCRLPNWSWGGMSSDLSGGGDAILKGLSVNASKAGASVPTRTSGVRA
jgi:hypothetical protein